MFQKTKEWYSVVRAKNPARIVLYTIFFINIALLLLTTGIILIIQLCCGSETNFLLQAYKMLLIMIGAIDINDLIDQTAAWEIHTVFSAFFYLLLIFATMVSFTGALIGYLTNTISTYVERSNAGAHPLTLSDHIVILNWNNRAAEIINDMLYKQKRERIVILVQDEKEAIITEIKDRLSDTVKTVNQKLASQYSHTSFLQRHRLMRRKKLRNRLTIIVRQGDIYATERLQDISLDKARSIMILYPGHTECGQRNNIGRQTSKEHEDCSTIKLLMQVADITRHDTSGNNQQIIVEVSNDWAMDLARHIIRQKQRTGKSNIIAVPVNTILGDILAQVLIMPELQLVYNELFSYRGAELFTKTVAVTDENNFIANHLASHSRSLPLTVMENHALQTAYYIALHQNDIDAKDTKPTEAYAVNLNKSFQMEAKTVIILGHSSKSKALLNGLSAFDREWRGQRVSPMLDVIIIDDEATLNNNNNYIDFPIVRKCVGANIYNRERICTEVSSIISATQQKVSILILSDDMTACEDTDRSVFTHLIYIQSVIGEMQKTNASFDADRIDVIVELCDPKNADIINNYCVSYVIISNRYISRLFNHLGEKEELYAFLTDILTYDSLEDAATGSKEIYSKRVGDYFATPPATATARQLIQAVYTASPPDNKAIVIGYLTANKKLILFSGNQHTYTLNLSADDYLIVFGNH